MGRKAKDNIRKPQILEYFRQVVNEEGIHKASVVKIAKKMGVSPNWKQRFKNQPKTGLKNQPPLPKGIPVRCWSKSKLTVFLLASEAACILNQ